MKFPNNDTTGFYKKENDHLHFAKDVFASNLYYEKKDEYTYPVNGWHWFDDAEIARQFFNLPDCSIIPDKLYIDIDPLIFYPEYRPKI